jgi:hypothetical protein
LFYPFLRYEDDKFILFEIFRGKGAVSYEKLIVFYYALCVVNLTDLAASAREILQTHFDKIIID